MLAVATRAPGAMPMPVSPMLFVPGAAEAMTPVTARVCSSVRPAAPPLSSTVTRPASESCVV